MIWKILSLRKARAGRVDSVLNTGWGSSSQSGATEENFAMIERRKRSAMAVWTLALDNGKETKETGR